MSAWGVGWRVSGWDGRGWMVDGRNIVITFHVQFFLGYTGPAGDFVLSTGGAAAYHY